MEFKPKIKHFCKGIVSFVNSGYLNIHASQVFKCNLKLEI